jgi:hypothetical protein
VTVISGLRKKSEKSDGNEELTCVWSSWYALAQLSQAQKLFFRNLLDLAYLTNPIVLAERPRRVSTGEGASDIHAAPNLRHRAGRCAPRD